VYLTPLLSGSLAIFIGAGARKTRMTSVGATTTRRRGRPVIDGGSRGAVGVATQVAGSSCVDVGEDITHVSAEPALGMRTAKHE